MGNNKTFTTSKLKTNQPSVKVKTETAGKIGLFGAISVIFGAMIGVGIFLKNGSVFRNNNGNPWGVLLSWGLVFLIALCTAYSYGEITRARVAKNSGLAGWSSRYIGERFGRFLKITYPLMYYSLMVFILTMFFAEAIFNIVPNYARNGIDHNTINFWYIILIGFCISLLIIFVNLLSQTVFTKTIGILSLVKFAPIILIIVCGITAGCLHPENNLFIHPEAYKPETHGEFTIMGVFNSLPAIMFAFDSFLIVGNISSKVEKPEKNLPLSIILSMSISGFLYFFVTIGQLLCGQDSPYGLFESLCGDNEKLLKAFTITISCFMFIALLSCCCSISFATVSSFDYAIENEYLFGSSTIKKITNGKRNKLWAPTIYLIFVLLFYFIIIGIPSGLWQHDQIYDGVSNCFVMFMFIVYGLVSLASIINRKTHKVPVNEVKYQKGQCLAAGIGFVGCMFVPAWNFIYTFLVDPVLDSQGNFKSWGLFYGAESIESVHKWQAAIIFWAFIIFIFAIPFINDLIIKLTNKNYKQPLIWQKQNNNKKIIIKE